MEENAKVRQKTGNVWFGISAIADVENAAEVIRLARATAFWKWRDDGKILLIKQTRCVCNQVKTFPGFSMEKK